MMMSFRKFFSDEAASPWKLCTRLAHASKVVSCVRPASRVTGSYLLLPGNCRLVLGSPPSRHCVTSVVRLSELHLLKPATYWPSTFTRNLKFRYGSKR